MPLLVEDVLAQGLVLGLILERHLVNRHLLCVRQAVGGRDGHNTELLAVIQFFLRDRVILHVTLSCRRAAAAAVAPVAGDSDEFLFLSENLA